MFPISYLEPISPNKYNVLYNRLDFIEKKMALSRKISKIRQKHEADVDLPTALAEAVNRGLITCNQINQHVLQEQRSRQTIRHARAKKIFKD